MNQNTVTGVRWTFWVIALMSLLWNGAGVANYLMQTLDPDSINAYHEAEQALIKGRPAWATAGFALAVFSGLLGSLLLLLKRAVCVPFFVLSFIGVVVAFIHALSVAGPDPARLLIPAGMSLVAAILLAWYSMRVKARGVLR